MKKRKQLLIIGLICFVFILSYVGTAEEQLGYAPINSIIMYNGGQNDFTGWGYLLNDTNWHICNGYNGTPNMQQKFVVGFDPEEEDYEDIGLTGGEEFHTLTIAEMPEHQHIFFDNYRKTRTGNIANGVVAYATDRMGGIQSITNAEGEDEPHENRPPYYVVIYIMRIS